MIRPHRKTSCGSVRTPHGAGQAGLAGSWWLQHREASLNWLALGMLLAAWNASDNGCKEPAHRRPQALRGYALVSMRAAAEHSTDRRSGST